MLKAIYLLQKLLDLSGFFPPNIFFQFAIFV